MLKVSFFAMALLSAPFAHASSDPQRVEVRHVSFADLDLSTESGRATLHRRVKIAVSQVCGYPEYRDYDQARHVLRCRDDARRRAMTQVDAAIAWYKDRHPTVTLATK